MAFPLVGNALTATNGAVRNAPPNLVIDVTRTWAPAVTWARAGLTWTHRVGASSAGAMTRSWSPPTSWPRSGLLRVYQVGSAPSASGAATTVDLRADGVVIHYGDASLEATVDLSADGLIGTYGDAPLDVTVSLEADGTVYDRAGDAGMDVSVEIVAAGIVAFLDDAGLDVTVQLVADGRVHLARLPAAVAVPQAAAAGWW